METKKIWDFKDLEGRKIKDVAKSDEHVEIITEEGISFDLFHDKDCCEDVGVEEIIGGELTELIDETVVEARKESGQLLPPQNEYDASYTWTFYIIRTNKISLTIRFYGTSNGYYSESVDCHVTVKKKETKQ
jgi:hypothetical protein